jgi:hypothetical protein
MKLLPFVWPLILGSLLETSSILHSQSAQQPASDVVPVSTVVSVEARHGKEIPAVSKEDMRVFQGHDRLRVTDWVPLQGNNAGLEILILIDEAADASVGNQFGDLKKFIGAQPPTTAIGVGYMEMGTVRMTQNFTTDYEAAGKALRIPQGIWSGISSPYLAVIDVMKRWPESKSRHVIFLVSSGIDPLQPGFADTYLDDAIQVAQRTGTQIYPVYVSHVGHFGHTFWRVTQGQNNLSKLADQTGSESYFQGFSTPVSFSPFLDMFAERLTHQYRLTFLIKPDKKPSYQHVRLETEVPNVELVTADRVYVPAAK